MTKFLILLVTQHAIALLVSTNLDSFQLSLKLSKILARVERLEWLANFKKVAKTAPKSFHVVARPVSGQVVTRLLAK